MCTNGTWSNPITCVNGAQCTGNRCVPVSVPDCPHGPGDSCGDTQNSCKNTCSSCTYGSHSEGQYIKCNVPAITSCQYGGSSYTTGSSRCASSVSVAICSNGVWSSATNCATGLTCSGNKCVEPTGGITSGKACTKPEDCAADEICKSSPYGSACVKKDTDLAKLGTENNPCLSGACNNGLQCVNNTCVQAIKLWAYNPSTKLCTESYSGQYQNKSDCEYFNSADYLDMAKPGSGISPLKFVYDPLDNTCYLDPLGSYDSQPACLSNGRKNYDIATTQALNSGVSSLILDAPLIGPRRLLTSAILATSGSNYGEVPVFGIPIVNKYTLSAANLLAMTDIAPIAQNYLETCQAYGYSTECVKAAASAGIAGELFALSVRGLPSQQVLTQANQLRSGQYVKNYVTSVFDDFRLGNVSPGSGGFLTTKDIVALEGQAIRANPVNVQQQANYLIKDLIAEGYTPEQAVNTVTRAISPSYDPNYLKLEPQQPLDDLVACPGFVCKHFTVVSDVLGTDIGLNMAFGRIDVANLNTGITVGHKFSVVLDSDGQLVTIIDATNDFVTQDPGEFLRFWQEHEKTFNKIEIFRFAPGTAAGWEEFAPINLTP